MPDETFDNVEVRVVRREDQGAYVLGVMLEGAFIPFASRKLGKADTLRERARDAQASGGSSGTSAVPPPPEQ